MSVDMMITLALDGETMTIDLRGGGGSIQSTLKEGTYEIDTMYQAAVDAIESMVLAHAVAGVKVWSDAYIKGINQAVSEIGRFL